eukprot:1926799-Amphidinium_carterae.1
MQTLSTHCECYFGSSALKSDAVLRTVQLVDSDSSHNHGSVSAVNVTCNRFRSDSIHCNKSQPGGDVSDQ